MPVSENPLDVRWYETFFQGIALDFWSKAIPPEQTRLEADFLAAELKLPPGGRVLDVPCGSGRHSLELASRGYRVTGLDISREQLAQAEKRSAEAGARVEWLRGDMKDLSRAAEFDGAFCMGNSFGYLQPEATRAFIAAIARALKPGGRFMMDTGMAAESVLPKLAEREWLRVDDILFLEENRYHPAESCIETTYTFIRNGETTVRTGWQWVYTLREIRSVLAAAGLRDLGAYQGLDRTPFALGAGYLLLTAEKEAR